MTVADHAVPTAEDAGLGVGVDPVAWLARDEDPAAAVLRAGTRLAAVRIADLLVNGVRGPIGVGADHRLDVTAYRVAVSVAGWRGPVVVDARQWPSPWEGIERTASVWSG